MLCKQCKTTYDIDLGKCPNCGYSPLHIMKGEDNTFRWVYSMNMWKNPTVFITVMKVFLIASLFPVLLVSGITLFEDGFLSAVRVFVFMALLMSGIMLSLASIAYIITGLINGGAYQVVFEMDHKGVSHIQMKKQFKKHQVIGMITAIAGAAAGSPAVAGSGLLSATKQSSYSKFSKVTKVKAKRARHVIYVNSGLSHNQIYVSKEDFEFVYGFICKRVEEQAK